MFYEFDELIHDQRDRKWTYTGAGGGGAIRASGKGGREDDTRRKTKYSAFLLIFFK